MRLAVLALLCVPSLATANTLTMGNTVMVEPSTDPDDGGGTFWGAGYVHDAVYVGGELAFETFDSDDLGISWHALVGVQQRLGNRVAVLADVGAGVTQDVTFNIGLFGSKSGFETERVAPSGAVRLHLVGELGSVGTATIGLGLSSEARSTMDGESGVGVGLGLYVSR
jgi:hypothetical protein